MIMNLLLVSWFHLPGDIFISPKPSGQKDFFCFRDFYVFFGDEVLPSSLRESKTPFCRRVAVQADHASIPRYAGHERLYCRKITKVVYGDGTTEEFTFGAGRGIDFQRLDYQTNLT